MKTELFKIPEGLKKITTISVDSNVYFKINQSYFDKKEKGVLIELRNDLDSVTDIEFNEALKSIVG